ncbi:MAG: hypothetical protein DCC65_05640 [Planctomycetota bacterium]|nr:MAG: hypothetical protein DCC65_05640 [Planctomycetota bacterium]
MNSEPNHRQARSESAPRANPNVPRIELEPSTALPPPEKYVAAPQPGDDAAASHAYALPGRPLHLCPSCDYNLTGLTARRCPECGQPFTPHEARMRGFETSEPMKELARRLTWGKTVVITSWTLIVIAFYCSNSFRITLSPFSVSVLTWTSLTSTGFFMLTLTISMLIIATIIRAFFEISWTYVLLTIGVTLSIIATLFIL